MKTINCSCTVCRAGPVLRLGAFQCRDFSRGRSFDYFRCGECGHVFIHPLPDQPLIGEYYEHKFVHGNYRDYREFSEGKRVSFDQLIEEEFEPHLDKAARILEFGCGEGFFLQRLFDFGYGNLWGVDVARAGIAQARKRLPDGLRDRLQVVNEQAGVVGSFVEGTLDCVAGLDVIEHLRQPLPFLAEVCAKLTESGLLILTTPRADSTMSRLMRSRWPYFLPLEHLNLFSSESMRLALSNAGFQEIRIARRKRSFDLEYALSSLEAIYSLQGKAWEFSKSLVKKVRKVLPAVSVDVGLMLIVARRNGRRSDSDRS